ncbi:type II toxin-antitoxin system HicA family toxin [Paraherbaspirillum soli]|uniref:Type II toxin-antitoxin system HicA family toxin n=1 Tax=Paraherbaspirillum soli TaxID=631222 RepID=A0ABW0M5E5_9BURK
MKAKHKKTLQAVFTKPTLPGIVFADLEALVISVGGDVREGEGSRIVFELNGKRLYPHPGKEAKRYQVEELRELLTSQGITP